MPQKREIICKRAREARPKKSEEAQASKRDLELITRVFDYTNTETWPHLQTNPQQLKITSIITLALIDEAVNPGVFENKLALHCDVNNVPKITYKLEPDTAKVFFNALTGVGKDTETGHRGTTTQPEEHMGKLDMTGLTYRRVRTHTHLGLTYRLVRTHTHFQLQLG